MAVGMSLMRQRNAEERHRYQFRAEAVRSRYDDTDRVGSHTGHVEPTLRWTMDVASLAAILSILAFTTAKSLDSGGKRGKAVWLLGRGWDVPISARLLSEEHKLGIGKTNHRGQIGPSGLKRGPDDRPDKYQLADLYAIWIRRPNPAVFEWSQVPPSISRDSIFGGSLDGVSRNLRREAILQAERQTRNPPPTQDNLKREVNQSLSRILCYIAPDSRHLHVDQFERTKGRNINHPPDRLCAQEIFTDSMLQLASKTIEIRGRTRRRAPLPGDCPDESRWCHNVISRLADSV
ncbi:hypothetical protein BDW68DRAFT_171777 [Aspergillus falconensis]